MKARTDVTAPAAPTSVTGATAGQLAALPTGTLFTGTFRVFRIDATLAKDSKPRLWVRLGDASGSIDACLMMARYPGQLERGYYQVAGVMQRLINGVPYAELTQVRLATGPDLLGGPSLLLRDACPSPARPALEAWEGLHQALPVSVRNFVASQVLDLNCDLEMLQAPSDAPGFQHPGGRLLRAHHGQSALFSLANLSGVISLIRDCCRALKVDQEFGVLLAEN